MSESTESAGPPREPDVAASGDEVRILPSLPGTRRAWVDVTGQLSGLFLSLREAEATGAALLPVPLHGGRALRAWSRVTRPVLAALADGGPGALSVPVDDVDVLGAAARVLGSRLLRERMHGDADELTDVLYREARVHGREPERLVVQLARVHGVLSDARAEPALAVWRAGL